MGLDIIAYSGVEPVLGSSLDSKNFDTDKYIYIDDLSGQNKAFPHRADDITSYSFYTFDKSYSFRAGSSSTYTEWRSHLLDFSAAKGRDFEELIEFSDCEGVLGTAVCKKLYDDFVRNQSEIQTFYNLTFKDHPPFLNTIGMSTYLGFMTAFGVAKDDGLLIFS
jgi:hypothetical protein